MTAIVPMLPDTAPFTAAQRAWLNGFFAGLLSGEPADATLSAAATVAPAPLPEPAEEFPWHDAALPIEERLALARERPLARQLMAAMAQLDCGQCGYLCQSYAEAIAGGAEKSLTRCVPGAKETARALKALLAAAPARPAAAAAAPGAAANPVAPLRSIVAPMRFEDRRHLNGAGSEKDTRHVVLHLNGSGLSYEVGDSIGVHVANCPELVEAVATRLGVSLDRTVTVADGRTMGLREAFSDVLDIARPADSVIELMARVTRDGGEAKRLAALAAGEAGDPFGSASPFGSAELVASAELVGFAELVDPDLLDLLVAFPSARPPLDELIAALSPLQPRLYSIASSPQAHGSEIHLTVGVVRYARNGRARKGVASTFLAERAAPSGELKGFVQKAHGFRLPASGDTPIVMIGPGTGIAPFRGFLAERQAARAKGRNWLFFGEQRRDHDFLYRDEIESWSRDGVLTRLDTAFSRDQHDKVYVQHRMKENARDLWSWLEAGAHVYVCGDAKRMARDVDQALTEVAATQGGLSAADAKAYVARLAREHRYQRDVY
jgi:sulfite reductase (NADPH) flavoprotein alpha-component